MKRFGLLTIVLCISIILHGQNRQKIWCFGDSAGIDFSTGNPTPIVTSLDSRGSCASIADTTGSLLFYSSYDADVDIGGPPFLGGEIYNSQHAIMFNGDSIVMAAWYKETVIINDPFSNTSFYVFSSGVTGNNGLYYNNVDMIQNGGLGAVIQKNIQLQSFKCTDGLTAIKHGNGRDWWVIFRRWDNINDDFYQYLITPIGISNVIIQNIGSSTDNGFTKMIFSHDGNKMAMINYPGLMEIYNFDRCSGILSNPITIHVEPIVDPFNHFIFCEFSPNNRFLYVTAYDDTCNLYQYDLQSPNPATTRITLETITNDLIGIGDLKLAPDGKIYLTHAWECTSFPYCYPYPDSVYNVVNMNLSVINYPDSLGTACGYAPFSYFLDGKRTYYGLPNNPNYDMGSLTGSSCDTITGITEPNDFNNSGSELYAYYSSEWKTTFINANKMKGKSYTLKLFDILGKEIFSESGKITSSTYTKNLNCISYSKGVYLVVLITEREKLVKRFFIQ